MKIKHLLKRTCLSLALLIGAGTSYATVYEYDFGKTTTDYWTVDNNGTAISTGTSSNPTNSATGYYYMQDGYNGHHFTGNGDSYYFNSGGYFMLGKNTATLTLPTYANEKIINVTIKASSSVSAKVTVNIYSETNAASTNLTWTTKGADYSYDIAESYQTTELKIQVTNANNAQITKVTVTTASVIDNQAPDFISSYPSVTNIKATSVDLLVKANETCKTYFMAVAAGADAPTVNEIIANDSVSCASNTETSATISGLTKATAYDIYVIAKDNAGNQQAAATKIANVSTESREISSVTTESKLYTGENATITWTSNGIAADANVKIELLSSNASVALAASTANDGSETVNIPAATAYGTDYKIRVSLADASDLYDETDNISIIPTITINKLLIDTATTGTNKGKSNYLDQVVRVKGLVTGIKVQSTTMRNFTLQNGDGTFNAAYAFYCEKDGDTDVAIGDSVYVEGKIVYYGKLLEIGNSSNHSKAKIINHDNDLPEPSIVSLKDAQSNAYMSRIVKIEGVTYDGTFLRNATDSIRVNYNLVSGNLAFAKGRKYDVTGGIGFNNASGKVGYQLLPRSFDTTAVKYKGKDREYLISDIYLYNNDTTLSVLKINGRDVKSDAKAVKVIDFSNCKGIVVQTKDAKASVSVKVNGTVVAAADLAAKTLAENDVVTIIVTAEDGTIGTRNINIQKDNRTFHFADLSTTTFSTGSTIALSWTQQNVDSLDLYFNDVKLNGKQLTSETSFSYTVPNGVYGTGSIEAIDCEDKLSIGSIVVTINDTQAPAALRLAPANAATNVATNVNLTISFDEAVKVANGAMLKANTAEAKIVVINDTAVKAYFENLDYATEYTVTLSDGAITDATGNTPALNWKFTTKAQPVPELFFSEYATGSSNNKYLEIYNPTEYVVDLSNYLISVGTWSGSGNKRKMTSTTFNLIGVLAPKEVFIIMNSSAADSLKVHADTITTSNVANFNGDDALRLYKVIDGDTSLIDVFGTYGIDPVTTFDVAGIKNAAVKHTLIRKSDIVCGSTDWAEQAGTDSLDSQWIVKECNDFSDIGRHGMSLKITNAENAANIDYKNHTITIEAVYGTDLTSILPQLSLPHGTTATINGMAVTENATFNFSQPAILLITSEDGTTTKWTITITVAALPSTAAEIRTFSFANAKPLSINIDTAAATVSALFDYGADISALTPVFTISAAASVSETTLTIDSLQQYTSVEPINFSTPWTIKVQAQDKNVSKVWTISASTLQPEALTIYQIQYTDKDASAYVGKFVSTIGVITSINGKEIYIQDSASAWNGVLVYDAKEVAKDAKAGDKVKVIGNVTEYSTITEIELAAIEVLSSGNSVEPIVMTIEDSETEAYEAVLVTFKNVTCKRIEQKNDYNNYIIEDATDTLTVYNKYKLDIQMIVDSVYDVTGIMHYYPAGKVFEIIPRSTDDIVKVEKENNGGNGNGGNNNPNAISDAAANISIYAYNRTIVVENANADIAVFDINGRMVAKRTANNSRIELQLPKSGLFIVKVGSTSRKVVLK
ncbi:MAG: Ig-like domain-containing protein [Salinivirgaceae bacterium]|nr:Ig-like domain-containing protein [Salinivirgaceae bacterium]